MATKQTRTLARFMMAPSVILLLFWMIVPLAMTIYYSFRIYRLISPERTGWIGWTNYTWFFQSPDFWLAMGNTLALVGGVLLITVVLGILIALLIDQPVEGQGVLRILVIAPFFVMPAVAASILENLFMHPQTGLFSAVSVALGYQPFYDKLNVAVVGCGGQGGVDLNDAARTENIPALCDGDEARAGAAFSRFSQVPKYKN